MCLKSIPKLTNGGQPLRRPPLRPTNIWPNNGPPKGRTVTPLPTSNSLDSSRKPLAPPERRLTNSLLRESSGGFLPDGRPPETLLGIYPISMMPAKLIVKRWAYNARRRNLFGLATLERRTTQTQLGYGSICRDALHSALCFLTLPDAPRDGGYNSKLAPLNNICHGKHEKPIWTDIRNFLFKRACLSETNLGSTTPMSLRGKRGTSLKTNEEGHVKDVSSFRWVTNDFDPKDIRKYWYFLATCLNLGARWRYSKSGAGLHVRLPESFYQLQDTKRTQWAHYQGFVTFKSNSPWRRAPADQCPLLWGGLE